ncbi:MAG: hypothetical protein OXF75_04125, partial [Acidimicrobiaceae bacterium]|nr:hypothetical protein [Acidimicrobiaceae bacterium]
MTRTRVLRRTAGVTASAVSGVTPATPFLHHLGDGAHLLAVFAVGFQCLDLGGERSVLPGPAAGHWSPPSAPAGVQRA